ncbi:hypothetical protein LENED_008995 [Lentinula edodes]|uniref:Uncharacterized protein n=1 Tax=Lentinula edodes TaxID=5353 RepID=A0A1Q3EIJ3_LENED|nr:hypothetical protein LENED_008995 [Lentinula edodes]
MPIVVTAVVRSEPLLEKRIDLICPVKSRTTETERFHSIRYAALLRRSYLAQLSSNVDSGQQRGDVGQLDDPFLSSHTLSTESPFAKLCNLFSIKLENDYRSQWNS